MALEKMDHPDLNGNGNGKERETCRLQRQAVHQAFLNTGLYLLLAVLSSDSSVICRGRR